MTGSETSTRTRTRHTLTRATRVTGLLTRDNPYFLLPRILEPRVRSHRAVGWAAWAPISRVLVPFTLRKLVDIWGGKEGRTKPSGVENRTRTARKPMLQEPEDITGSSSSQPLLFL